MILTTPNMVLNSDGTLTFETTPTLSNGILDLTASSAKTAILSKVELYNGSTLVDTCTCSDRLLEMTIERAGQNSKFFGFGIIHKLTVRLLDLNNNLAVVKGNIFKVYAGYTEDGMIKPYPTFYVDTVEKDTVSNVITAVCYDCLYKANTYSVAEVIEAPYTIGQFAEKAISLLGVNSVLKVGVADSETCFSTYYEEGANFDGTESYKEALDALAEATQTIYYINNNDNLVFKRLSVSGSPVFTIGEDIEISLQTSETKKLTTIASVTELGDNLSATTGATGITQYVRNNPFWELRDDLSTLLSNAIGVIGNIEAVQFSCNWIGNFLLEIGDKIAVVALDGTAYNSYVINDAITFDAVLIESTGWVYEENDNETETTPNTIGEAIKQTVAKVDKVNREITLRVSEVEENTATQFAEMKLTTDSISSSVGTLKENTDKQIADLQTADSELKTRVSTVEQTANDFSIKFQDIDSKGVSKVVGVGFKFDEEGLEINKEGSNVITNITNNGMTVSNSSGAVLVANKEGVEAVNLRASTHLDIGKSRFMTYDSNRTGCFWNG